MKDLLNIVESYGVALLGPTVWYVLWILIKIIIFIIQRIKMETKV